MPKFSAVFQGKFDLLENIKISPVSRGYTFSDGIYEVIPFYKKTPIALDDHLYRFQKSADAISIKLDTKKIFFEISQLINMCDAHNGYVYYQISRYFTCSYMYHNIDVGVQYLWKVWFACMKI